MSPLVRELLVNGLMAGTAMRTAKKTSAGAAYFLPAACLAVLGTVFLSLAGYNALLSYTAAPAAMIIVAATLFVIAGSIAFIGHYRVFKKKPVKKPFDGNFIDNIENTVKSFMEGLEDPVKDNPKMAVLMAALAGLAAGDKLGDKMNMH